MVVNHQFKFLKKWKSFESVDNSNTMDYLNDIHDLFLGYIDDGKCKLTKTDYYILVKMLDYDSTKEMKDLLESWGFKYFLNDTTFSFWSSDIVNEFLKWVEMVKDPIKYNNSSLWIINGQIEDWVFKQDIKNNNFFVNYNNIWRSLKRKYFINLPHISRDIYINKFMEDMIKEYFNLDGYKISVSYDPQPPTID